MANPATGYTNDANSRAAITATVIAITDDPANNSTTVTWSAAVSDGNSNAGGYNYNQPNGSGGYATGDLNGGYSRSGGLTWRPGYGSYDFGSGVIGSPYYPRSSGTITAYVGHDTNGAGGTVNASATFSGGDGPAGSASASTTSYALTTFSSPSIPTSGPSLSRVATSTSTNANVTVVAAGVSSAGSLAVQRYEYTYRTSSNNGASWSAWSGYVSLGGSGSYPNISPYNSTASYAGPISATSTLMVEVATRAVSNYNVNWGYGPSSSSTIIAGAPNAPAAPTISNKVANTLTLSWSAPQNNGASISSYTIQGSTDNGLVWSDLATGVTATSKVLTGLTIAATYKFRVIANNSSGASQYGAESISQFISAYGYRWTGADFNTAVQNCWVYTGNGSDTAIYNGTTYTGWRIVQNTKRQTDSGLTDLTQ